MYHREDATTIYFSAFYLPKITYPAAIMATNSTIPIYIIRLDVDETRAMIVNPWAPRCFGIKKALINVIFTSNTNFRKVINGDRLTRLFAEGRGIGQEKGERLILIEWRVTVSQLKACLPISSNTRGLAMATSKEIDKWKRLIGGRDGQVKKIDRNWDSLCTAMKLRSKEDLSSRATYIPPPTQFKLHFAATTNWIDSNLTLYVWIVRNTGTFVCLYEPVGRLLHY